MSDFNEFSSDTEQKAKGWWAGLPFPAQAGVGLGTVAVVVGGVWLIGTSVFNNVTGKGQPYQLSNSQAAAVKKACESYFTGINVVGPNGTQKGVCASASTTDSDNNGYVSASGKIPKLVYDANKKPVAVEMATEEIQCNVPREGALAGCKPAK